MIYKQTGFLHITQILFHLLRFTFDVFMKRPTQQFNMFFLHTLHIQSAKLLNLKSSVIVGSCKSFEFTISSGRWPRLRVDLYTVG